MNLISGKHYLIMNAETGKNKRTAFIDKGTYLPIPALPKIKEIVYLFNGEAITEQSIKESKILILDI